MPLPRPLKWIGIGLGALLGVLGVAALILALVGRARLDRNQENLPGLTVVPGDSSALARGEHVLKILGCRGCHGEDLGGRVFLDLPLGRFVATNLTPGQGGVGATYREEDWDHAIRFGMRPNHTSLVPVMPYRLFNHLSDGDAAALIAYLQRLPPVDNPLPPTTVRLPAYIAVGLGGMGELFGRLGPPPSAAPPPGTAAHGAYLAATICVECHGERLQGGKHPAPDAPPGPSLVPASYWPRPAFAEAVRTGIAPGNRKLSDWMPVPRLRYLTDEEIEALYAYIQTLRPGTTGR